MPTILTEQPQWRDDTSVPVEVREAVLRIAEAGDSPALMAILVNEFIQKFGNRSQYLKLALEQLTGASGSIDNLPDVDPTGKTPGSVLTFNGTNLVYEPPSEGVNILQNGSNILPEELADDDRTFENGIGSWVNETGTTLTQTNVLVRSGTQALRIETTATGDVTFTTATGTSGYPITAGTVKLVEGYLRNQATARGFVLAIRFYNAAGTFLSEVSSADVSANNAQWFQATFEATAPIDLNDSNNSAAYYALAFTIKGVTTTGEFHYVDDISVKGVLKPRKFLDVLGTQVTDDPAANALRLGSLSNTYKPISADTVAQSGDNTATYVIDATAGNIIITLPNGFDDGYKITLQRIDNTDNTVTFNVLGTVDSASVSQSLQGIYSGLQVIHKSGNEWLFLPFSGGALGEIRAAKPDGSAPSEVGTWLPLAGVYHNRADYPAFKPFFVPDNLDREWIDDNYTFVPHGNANAQGQLSLNGGFIWAGVDKASQTIFAMTGETPPRVIKSSDEGDTWTQLTLPTHTANSWWLYQLEIVDGRLYLHNETASLFHRSDDLGDTWVDLTTATGLSSIPKFVKAGVGSNGQLVGMVAAGFEYSLDYGNTWSELLYINLNDGVRTIDNFGEYSAFYLQGYWFISFYRTAAAATVNRTWITDDLTSTNANNWIYTQGDLSRFTQNSRMPFAGIFPIYDWNGVAAWYDDSANSRHIANYYDFSSGVIDLTQTSPVSTSNIFDRQYQVIRKTGTNGLFKIGKLGGYLTWDMWALASTNEYVENDVQLLKTLDDGLGNRTFDYQQDAGLSFRHMPSGYSPQAILRFNATSPNAPSLDSGGEWQDAAGAKLDFNRGHTMTNLVETEKNFFVFSTGRKRTADGVSWEGDADGSVVARCSRLGYDPDTQFYLPDWNSQAYIKVAF